MLAAGVSAAWIAIASPIAHLDHHLLTAHMVQHLVLMVVAAPLILLGARSIACWDARPHPLICWLAGTLTVIVWHAPAVFELALRSPYWHQFEQTSFLVGGSLFWWPVIDDGGATSRWSVPLYLFLATLPCDVLSAFLVFCGHVVYRPYVAGHGEMFGLSPLEDQALAGALMWVAVTFAYLVPALVVTTRLLSGDLPRQRKLSRSSSAGIFTQATNPFVRRRV
jgi:putative membrane protein